jgi:hypothetical protein
MPESAQIDAPLLHVSAEFQAASLLLVVRPFSVSLMDSLLFVRGCLVICS